LGRTDRLARPRGNRRRTVDLIAKIGKWLQSEGPWAAGPQESSRTPEAWPSAFHARLESVHVGVFHHVSPEHLDKYVSEFEFRYNDRKTSDSTRAAKASAMTAG
jgi:hypothetical protein